MKIYFAGSIRGGRGDASIYKSLILYLSSIGEVLTEHVGYASLTEKGEDGPSDRYIHDMDMAWLGECDCVVAEVSVPSLGVGYELGYAVAMKKPVLCLFNSHGGRRLSAMIAGNPAIRVAQYKLLEEARGIIVNFVKALSRQVECSVPGGGSPDPPCRSRLWRGCLKTQR